MRECANITLKNGFHLVVLLEDLPGVGSEISVVTTDEDDTFNQDLVKVYTHDLYNGERFDVDLYLDPDKSDTAERFEIRLHHDNPDAEGPDDDTNDDEDEYDEYYDEVQEDFTDVDKSLFYGCAGEEVKNIQRRLKELGYFNGSIGGNYLTKTEKAVKDFQSDNDIVPTGICDNATYAVLFSDAEPKEETAADTSTDKRYAVNADWWTSDIQQVFAKGVTAKITDVETGLTWKEQRRGGTNHADVQPLTKEDTANLKKAYGGKWAWTRRAIWVTIGDKTYAASMNGMPHGGSSIKDNGFDGHHCIHYKNSRTHGTNRVDENHQKMVKKAAETPLPNGL